DAVSGRHDDIRALDVPARGRAGSPQPPRTPPCGSRYPRGPSEEDLLPGGSGPPVGAPTLTGGVRTGCRCSSRSRQGVEAVRTSQWNGAGLLVVAAGLLAAAGCGGGTSSSTGGARSSAACNEQGATATATTATYRMVAGVGE